MVVLPGGRQTKHLTDPALVLLSRRVSGRVSGLVIKLIGRLTKLTALTAVLLSRATQLASRQPDGLAGRHEQTQLVHFNRINDTAGAHSRFYRQTRKSWSLLPLHFLKFLLSSRFITCSPHLPPAKPTQVEALFSLCPKMSLTITTCIAGIHCRS